jgi:3-oxoacyl-[acyl-carrier protein] reductase
VLDMNIDAAAQVTAALPKGLALRCDVSDSAAVDTAIDRVAAEFGRLDILVNNAGQLGSETLAPREAQLAGGGQVFLDVTIGMSDSDWRRMIATHLDGTFYCCRAALRHMVPAGRGAIINMSSIAGLTGSAGSPHYSAAKGGILAFSRALAREVIPQGVRINALAPGFVETPLRDLFSDAMKRSHLAATPVGRAATADEIAGVAVFLASDEASYVVGETISPNGGFLTI